MKIFIPEQTFELDADGYGRLRFELVKDESVVPVSVDTVEVPVTPEVATPEVVVPTPADIVPVV